MMDTHSPPRKDGAEWAAGVADQAGARIPRLPTRAVVGWAIGTLAMTLYFNSFSFFFLRYLTDFAGISAALAGSMIALSKVYDAATDALMGSISDRTSGRFGRRRPYLLAGGIACAVSFVLLFTLPTAAADEWKSASVMLVLILYATGYTIFNVPYLSMPSEMTIRPEERAALMSGRLVAFGVGALVAVPGGAYLISLFDSPEVGHRAMAASMGSVIVLLAAMCFFMTGAAPPSVKDDSTEQIPFSRKVSLLFGNRPFLSLLMLKLFLLTPVAITFGTFLYYAIWILEIGYELFATLTLCLAVGQIAGVPFWTWCALRLGNHRTFYLSTALYCGIAMTWLLGDATDPVWVTMFRGVLQGAVSGGNLLVSQTLLHEAIEYDRLSSGIKREGLLAGMYTTIEKLAYALGTAITGVVLGMSGYLASDAGGPVAAQPSSAITAIYLCQGVAPTLFMVVACVFMHRYPLTGEKLASLRRERAIVGTPAREV